MPNERVENALDELPYAQFAQVNRTDFTPGKAGAVGEANWPIDYRVPVGLPSFEASGAVDKTFNRVFLTDRNIICDAILASVPSDPAETTQDNNGGKERQSGYNWADGA